MNHPAPSATPPPHCEVCGASVDAGRVGAMCPACLLSLATSTGDGADDPSPDFLDAFRHGAFGDYQLFEQIARGGMGVVYRARQTRLNREVAIKMILAGELAAPDALRMFQTEARVAAALHHPNIVPVYEIGEHEMQPYFSMRFVSGGQTIADWGRDHAGDWKEIARQVATVARAVAHAHERGILHRDIKPSNILWDPADGPQVTDFGLAKLLDTVDGTVTLSSSIIGSPSYMAPEQCGGRSAEITTATDVYGIGTVLYELLAGRPPFLGKSVVETARMAAETAPPPLSGIPRELATVCLKCLAKSQSDRYPTAAALAADLERFSRGEPVSAVPIAPGQRLIRWARRRPVPATLSALLILSFIGGLSGVMWQWQRAEVANNELSQTVTRLEWRQLDGWLANNEHSMALAYLARAIRHDPTDWRAAMFAMSIIDTREFPIPAAPSIDLPALPLLPVILSSDGRTVAAALDDGSLRLWDVPSGNQTSLIHPTSPVTALTLTDGKFPLWFATKDGIYASARPESLPRATPSPIRQLIAGSHAITGLSAAGAERWDISSPSSPPRWHPMENAKGAATCAAGDTLLLWEKKRALILDAAGRVQLDLAPEIGFVKGAVSPSGEFIALIDGEFRVRLWHLPTAHELPSVQDDLMSVHHLAFSPDGAKITIAGSRNQIITFETRSGTRLPSDVTHRYEVEHFITATGGRFHASLGSDGNVLLINATTGRGALNPVANGIVMQTTSIGVSADGATLMVEKPSGSASILTFWTASHTNPPSHRIFPGHYSFNSARISPDGHLGIVGMPPSNRCVCYDLRTGEIQLDTVCNGDPYVTLFSPEMDRTYVLTANGWLHGWHLGSGRELWPARQHSGLIRPACLSADGKIIIAGHNNGLIRSYDTATGNVLREMSHPGEVKALHWAPDGSHRFLSTSTDKLAHIWNADTGEKLQTFTGHTHTIISAAWSPDARRIATASYDSTARLWDARTGQSLAPPMPHSSWLCHIVFSPDGRKIATACRDDSVRLWDAATAAPLTLPLMQRDTGHTVRFTAGGLALYVRTHAGFRFLDATNGDHISIDYPEPMASGTGMDSENYHSTMSADGTQVFLGYAMNHGAHWKIAQPRESAPEWFPDLLESLAMMVLDSTGTASTGIQHVARDLPARILAGPPEQAHHAWARRVLGLD